MNILPCSASRITKSERPAASALVPATVPRITEMMGILPEQAARESSISPVAPSAGTPSSTRWPVPSHMAMIGRIVRLARSIVDAILLACISPMLPPKTPGSCAIRMTRLPSIWPCPVTTPSPTGRFRFMVPSVDLCLT